jgi:hypothetical protein
MAVFYHKSYLGLDNHIEHVRVKGESGSGDYKTDHHFHTNNIENFWSTFKRGIIGIYHFTSPQHLHRYATEFSYRYNNRTEAGANKFVSTVAGSGKKRLSYDRLIGKK